MSRKILVPVNMDAKIVEHLNELSEALITNKSAIVRTIIKNSLEQPADNLPEVLKSQIQKLNKQEFHANRN